MASVDPVALYLLGCKNHGVKRPNPQILKYLQQYQEDPSELEVLDLSNNYVGNRGIHAILEVIEKLPNFRYLNVSNQKLYNTDLSEDSVKGNATVDRIVEVLKSHPTANALDISANPVSNYAGRKLLGLVQVNKRVCRVELKNTRIDFDLRKRIAAQCEKNTSALWEEVGADHHHGNEDRGFGETSGWTPAAAAADLTTLGGGRARRTTVRSEGVDPEKAKNFVPQVYPKSESEYALIVELLSHNVLFGFLTSKDLKKVAGAMQRVDFNLNDEIMVQGTTNDKLYIIQEGQADILKEGQKVFLKHEGTAVGEIELMYDTACVATVKVCSPKMITWCLDRDTYRNLVMGTAINRRETYMKHLESIPFLHGLDNYEKMQIADALSTDEYQQGEYIIRYDKEGEWMFIILEGTVEVIGRDNDGSEKYVCDFTTGECIGELEFLNKHRTVADVRAKTYVQTAKLNRRHFEMCMGPVIDYLKRNSSMPKFDYYNQVLSQQRPGSSFANHANESTTSGEKPTKAQVQSAPQSAEASIVAPPKSETSSHSRSEKRDSTAAEEPKEIHQQSDEGKVAPTQEQDQDEQEL